VLVRRYGKVSRVELTADKDSCSGAGVLSDISAIRGIERQTARMTHDDGCFVPIE